LPKRGRPGNKSNAEKSYYNALDELKALKKRGGKEKKVKKLEAKVVELKNVFIAEWAAKQNKK
jgi:hypothetical protein